MTSPPSPSRFRNRPSASIWIALALFVAFAMRMATFARPRDPLPPAGTPIQVLRAVDGDTLLLETGHRIRLLGVNTPETKHPKRPPEPFGEEASEFTHARVDGRNVTLEFDRERRDDYWRTLAYVWVDGRLLNKEIIAAGFSRAETRFPIRSDRKRLFEDAEADAKSAKRGIWSVKQETAR
jgi:micrococcal nuclease